MKTSFLLKKVFLNPVQVFSFCIIFLLSAQYISAIESSSTNYILRNDTFGSGSQMNSTNFSISGSLSDSTKGLWSSNLLPLSVGTVTSCGKITTSGTYTLGLNLTGISGSCFIVAADNVIIEGAGYTVTAVSGNSSYAIIATSSTDGGNGHNVTINNITFNNFTGGVNASGHNSSVGVGGNGGTITIGTSTVGNIISNGGTGSTIDNGGNGGIISISNSATGHITSSGAVSGTVSIIGTDLNLSNDTYTAGTLNISYTGNLTTTNTSLSALSHLVINGSDLGSYIGGSFPLIPGIINICGTIYFGGTYTFSGDIVGSCDIVNTGVILDGNGNTLTGNVTANNYGVTLSDISVTGLVSTTGASPGALVVNNASNLSGSINVTGLISGDGSSSLSLTTISAGGSVATSSVNFVGDVTNNGIINAGNSVIGKTTNNGTINTGVGSFTFNASSTNTGTVNGNAILNGSSTNIGTITGNLKFNTLNTVSGSVIFSDFSFVGTGYVNGNIYDSGDVQITSWIFNGSSTNAGILKGNAIFNNTSINEGTVIGNSIFNNTSVNIGNITGDANVYYPVNRPLGGNIDGHVIYHEYPGLYFNDNAVGHGVVGKWDDLNNWWTDIACTIHAPVIPTSGDDVIVISGDIATSSISAEANTVIFQGTTSNSISLSVSSSSTRAVVFNASSTNAGIIIGNVTFSGPDTENTGTVSGFITREYNAGIYTVVTDFTHNGIHWIVQAINGARVDLSQATYSFLTNTFQVLNNGIFTAWNALINGGSAGIPNLIINSPVAGSNIKWVPSVDWGTNNLCQYKIDAGSYFSVNCANNGSDIPRPAAGSHTIFIKSTDAGGNVTEKSVLFVYDNTQPVYTSCGTDLLDEATRPYYYLTSNVGNCTVTASTTLRGDNNGGGSFYTLGSVTGSSTNITFVNVTATGTVSNFNNITVSSSTIAGSIGVSGIFSSDIKSIFGSAVIESGGVVNSGLFTGNVLNKTGGQIVNSTTTPVTVLGGITNAGTINGNIIFNASSTNTGTVNGNLTLNASSTNVGLVNGDLKYNTLSAVNGVVSFSGSTSFPGTGNVTGSIKDSWDATIVKWVFNGSSLNNGFTIGDAFFNDLSINASTISGDAHFSDSSANAGTVTGSADAYHSVSVPLSGTINGAITYHGYSNAISFNDVAGDHSWSNPLNWFTDTTLEVPLGRAPIANEDVVLFASTTLPSSITSNIFFAESGKTLSGGGFTLTGNISGNGAYGGYDAYNFNLENITVVGTTTAIGGDGIPGISDGGKGGIINVTNSSTGGVVVNGGDPLQNGGDAGSATIVNSFAVVDGTRILAVGGASTGCGFGGNGGNISLIDSSGYILVTAIGQDATSTCVVIPPPPSSRSSGSTNVVGVYTPPASNSQSPTGANNNMNGSSGSIVIPSFLNINRNIGKLNLANLPSLGFGFSDGNLGTSNFVNPLAGLLQLKNLRRFSDLPVLDFSDNFNNLLNTPLPKSLLDIVNTVPSIKAALALENIVNGYDLYKKKESLINTPTISEIKKDKISVPKTIMFVSVNGKEEPTNLSINEKGNTYQILDVMVNSMISVTINNGKKKAPKILFNEKEVAVTRSNNLTKLDFEVPQNYGTYFLIVENLMLKINVMAPDKSVENKSMITDPQEMRSVKRKSWFQKIKAWFF